MFHTTDVFLMARTTKNPLAQQAFYEMDEYRTWLRVNQYLSPAIWENLYSKDYAHSPVARRDLLLVAPTNVQARKVLTDQNEEVRLSAIAKGVKNLDLPTIKELISAPYFDDSYAHALIESKQLPPDLALALWSATKAAANLDFDSAEAENFDRLITHYDLFTNQEILATLTRPADVTYFLTRAIDCRPALLNLIRTTPKPNRYYAAAATSRHLSAEFAKEILGYVTAKDLNPSECDLRTLIQLSENIWVAPQLRLRACTALLSYADQPKLAKKINAAPPVRTIKKWGSLKENLTNAVIEGEAAMPNPTDPSKISAPLELDEIFYATEMLGGYSFPTLHKVLGVAYEGYGQVDPGDEGIDQSELPTELTDVDLALQLEPLGLDGWRLFFSLLLDWKGEFSELLTVVKTTTLR